MLIIISPAKKLDFSKKINTKKYTIPNLLEDSSILIERLRQCSINDLTKLMNISYGLAEMNLERFIQWKTPFTVDNSKHAISVFNGEVYTGINSKEFNEEELEIAQKNLRILSGLYGILKPLDIIQAYRLEMGTKLPNDRGKNLYDFWGDKITEEINNSLAEINSNHLVNLASNEYFKAIKVENLNAQVITPVFKQYKNSVYRVISFYAKKARGLMTKYIITNKLQRIEDIKGFNLEGYYFDANQSSNDQWVFIR